MMEQSPEELLGKLAGRFRHFPLLLKFLDARDTLFVQVHPSDRQTAYLPPGESGKTEAWVVLEAGAKGCIYAGLTPETTEANLRVAIANGTVTQHLTSFKPRPGDSVLLTAGTVHSLGDLVVFEVQENSDVTFRLYDWDHIDGRTGQPRTLHVDQALACIDFAQGAIGPGTPVVEERASVLRERILDCEHFAVSRFQGGCPFTVGAAGTPRIVVCMAGEGQLEYAGGQYAFGNGDVVLLPAAVGACLCQPRGALMLLEISLPERT